jgi:hypothetical protein
MKELPDRFILDTFDGITIIDAPEPKPDKVSLLTFLTYKE